MYVFVPPVQPHASFSCSSCSNIIVMEAIDAWQLEGDTSELGCPGCSAPCQVSSKYMKQQLERDQLTYIAALLQGLYLLHNIIAGNKGWAIANHFISFAGAELAFKFLIDLA